MLRRRSLELLASVHLAQDGESEQAGLLADDWDRASDFDTTGLNSNCTGGIRSRGSMATAGDQITHQLASVPRLYPEISGAHTTGDSHISY